MLEQQTSLKGSVHVRTHTSLSVEGAMFTVRGADGTGNMEELEETVCRTNSSSEKISTTLMDFSAR